MVSLLAILLAVAACPLDATPEDYEGKTVAAIHFQPQAQPLSATETNRITGQLAGRPFTRAAVRDMILQLYATGRYDDLEVDAALDNGQVILTVRTRQNWFISRVAVEGVEEPPNREQLVNATRLELGALYSGESLVEAIRGLEEALRGNGYYHPRIQPLVERYPNYDEMHILFLVHPGPRAYFARPVLAGNLKLSESRIVRATHWKRWWGLLGWQKLTESRLQQAVERVRQTYQKNDFLLARVSLTNLDFDPDLNRATPALQIEAGPKVRVTASGAKLSGGRLKELVPVYQEQSVDQDLLIEGRRKMENHFQSKGHFDAQVSFDRKNISAAEQAIEYSVDLGGRYRVAHVAISGNAYFDVFTIRERMSILSAGRVYNRNGRFSEDLLGRDKAAIEELYNGSGFRDVRVESRVEKNYRGHPRDVAVYLDVKEGEQWFVNSLELSGVDLRLYPAVKAILTSTEGQPYSTLTMSADRDNILNLYFDNGYPDATLEILSTPSAIPRRMDVKYVVTEGRRLFVRDVQVNGLKSTRPGLVRTRITLVPDEPLSYSSMVFSQRRLYDLGIFAKVDMGLQNPGGSTREKRVLYQMEEASRYSFNGGVGAEFGNIGGGTGLSAPAGEAAFAPRVSLGISRLNFLGLGHTVSLQTRLSTLQERGVINYFAPQFRGSEKLNLTFSGLFDNSRNVRTFSSRRREGSLQLSQRFTRAITAQYRYTYRHVKIYDVKIDPGLIPLYSQPARVGLIAGAIINDRRDDPLNATRGYYYSADFSGATRAFGSESSFTRLLGRNSSYHRLTRDLVVSRNTMFGWIHNFGSRDIPLPEHFFAGGSVSHRGFPENQAGPRDLVTGFPIGGRALLFNQTELRFPFIGTKLAGVVFHDAGNVYTNVSAISFRFHQRGETDFDYMVHAAGIGVRYRTPVGPVRLDFAFGLNSPRFFGYTGSIDDLINRRGQRLMQRIGLFQFHFSLGQAF